ncbi:MAG: Shikimate dehydrogenase [Planctomycetota bacterium]|jgi:3-dehydroquinate dehydratase/shikimate dehydrogenase
MAEIVASILAENREQVLHAAARAAMDGADWVELRLDRWPLDADLEPVIGAIRLPVLVACRTQEDGGAWRGTLGERRELFGAALSAGAQGIDLEHWETWTPSLGRNRLRLLVRSYHHLTAVPKDLRAVHERLFAQQCTVAKIAVTAHDLADAAPVLELMASVDQDKHPTVAFAMGRTAWPTRLLACIHGARLVYGCVDGSPETAPGQVPVDLLAGLYHVHRLTRDTRVFGLLGNPALHSLGPWLHNRAFQRLGLDALYLPFETSRPEAVVAMLPRPNLGGLSVTAPFKQAMAAQCNSLDAEAGATGVVNTLTFDAHGMVGGHNTDVAGVRGALQRAGLGAAAKGRNGVVLGTGGAARAAVLALQQLGMQVTMLGRTLDPARAFAAGHGVRLGSLQQRLLDELQPAVVVHATPVGSSGRPDEHARLLPQWKPLPGTFVLDMVYQPVRTRLLADARAEGAVPVPGVEMFLTQAAAQVEHFTGRRLDEEELRRFLAGSAGRL